MKKIKFKKLLAGAFAAAVSLVSLQIPMEYNKPEFSAEAASTDYPPQLMNLSVYDNSKNLTASSKDDKASCTYAAASGTLNEQWRIDYCGNDSNGNYYKIVNQASGRLLTPSGYDASAGKEAVIFGNENDKSQYWYISAVSEDKKNNDLYYKITNYKNNSLALTSGSVTTLSNYSGSNNQKWLLNSAGLQGFAGYCKNDNEGSIKAGDIGGALGQTVEVSTFNDLKKYAESTTPYTIIVNNNISVNTLDLNGDHLMCKAGRIYVKDNKTIIGSYSKHTLFNVQFCTANNAGSNIIIKNFDMQHDKNSNNNDNIICYFGAGENIWVDHVTFTGHNEKLDSSGNYNKYGNNGSANVVDEDKFLACCYDADYCTVSESSFGAHEYGLILGYPSDDAASKASYDNFPRMSIIGNRFNYTITRGPGLMRWGYYHSLNNYVSNFSMGYTVHSGSDIYAENCYYEKGGNVICDWNQITYPGAYAETGSKSSGCSRTTLAECQSSSQKGSATASSFRPTNNYTYKTLSADNARSFTSAYSGCQSDKNNYKYVTSSSAGIPSAYYMSGPSDGWAEVITPASMPIDAYFQIKNVNSGLCLDVDGAAAANGTNVQQWGADASSPAVQNTWRFVPSDEENYYYIQSMVGDKTYVLDVTGGKSANGTNIEIYKFKANNNQKFMITKNSDGTYKIRPKVGNGSAMLEIASASTSSGANAALWENTGSSCQDWTFTEVTFNGESMDTSVMYMFKNSNSGLYMEVKDGSDSDNANIQQWGANGTGPNRSGEWNSWKLKAATGDLYYIVSNLAGGRYININNDNAELLTYNKSTNTQMMRFVKNPDGSYLIVPRTGFNKTSNRYTKALEVANASSAAGGNVQAYTVNGNACQNWVIETFTTTKATTAAVTTTTTTTTTTASTTSTAPVTTTHTVTTEVGPPYLIGDVDRNGRMNIDDVITLQKYLVKKETVIGYAASDMNGDGKINVFDLVILKRWHAKRT